MQLYPYKKQMFSVYMVGFSMPFSFKYISSLSKYEISILSFWKKYFAL